MGPLYLSPKVGYKTIGKNQVAIPSHFLKILFFSSHKEDWYAWIFPNEPINSTVSLDSFRSNIDDIQEKSGLFLTKDLDQYLFVPIPVK